uniref:Uncharacterized protein n=1 Tax=Eutreptiella gymnastica TaxID=73025 RepID=A0A7S4D0E1_9EUGL|mmetsp:Transcript_12170/g.18663  ORF Transcript_12170/g.18663 Transcript_12170/m.18663 type:complete len:106 (-) Transcript_12170:111-428(-)
MLHYIGASCTCEGTTIPSHWDSSLPVTALFGDRLRMHLLPCILLQGSHLSHTKHSMISNGISSSSPTAPVAFLIPSQRQQNSPDWALRHISQGPVGGTLGLKCRS